jgi:hypothetical protein
VSLSSTPTKSTEDSSDLAGHFDPHPFVRVRVRVRVKCSELLSLLINQLLHPLLLNNQVLLFLLLNNRTHLFFISYKGVYY